MNCYKFGLLILTTLLTPSLWAHPVSFKDAVSVMSYNTPLNNELLLTYSLSPSFAVAGTYLREQKSEFYIPRLNFLVKRWNNEDSQGNIYFSTGAGVEKFNSESFDVKLAELIADWESRKYLIAFEHQYFLRENKTNPALANKDLTKSKMRLGFAPFLADYNDLNVWYVAEFNHKNQDARAEMMQFMRFYKKNILWEIGAGFDGSLAFNFMIHM